MVLFIVLGMVVLVTFVVLGMLFFMLRKEGQKEEKVVPLTDLQQLRKGFSPDFEKPKAPKNDIVPPFEPKVGLPLQKTQTPPAPVDDTFKKRAQELEEELKKISQKAQDQSTEAKQMIDNLTKENDALKSQKASLQDAQTKLIQVESEANHLKIQNTGLQTQLDATNAKVQLFEEQMAAVKIQMGDEIARANATVAQLTQEKESLAAAPKAEPDLALRQEITSLESELTGLKQKYSDLEKNNQQLRELNTHLMEKTDALQYEMTKARAQSSGLERLSFNYKNQLEDFFKKMSLAQSTNDNLSKAKNRLEGMVEEIKLQNEELVKKDQLTQFELEKNRSRLLSLERECEELKARMQNGG